jgi:hypothetical protein
MYRIAKRFEQRGPGSEINIASYPTLELAKKEIQRRLEEDSLVNVKAIYSLYEGYDLLESFDQSKLQATPRSNDESSSGSAGGQGKAQNFRPSPLNTSPRPAGTMPPSWKDDDEGEDNK